MTLKTVTKRSGHEVPYDRQKIYNAIAGASNDAEKSMTHEEIDQVTGEVEREIENLSVISVEEIQDMVETVLVEHGFVRVAKAYILYRAERTRVRQAGSRLMKIWIDSVKQLVAM